MKEKLIFVITGLILLFSLGYSQENGNITRHDASIMIENDNYMIDWDLEITGHTPYDDNKYIIEGNRMMSKGIDRTMDVCIVSPIEFMNGSKLFIWQNVSKTIIYPHSYFCNSSNYGWLISDEVAYCNYTIIPVYKNPANKTIDYYEDMREIINVEGDYVLINNLNNATIYWNHTNYAMENKFVDITDSIDIFNKETSLGDYEYCRKNTTFKADKEYKMRFKINVNETPVKYSVCFGDIDSKTLYFCLDPTLTTDRTWTTNTDFTNGTTLTNLITTGDDIRIQHKAVLHNLTFEGAYNESFISPFHTAIPYYPLAFSMNALGGTSDSGDDGSRPVNLTDNAFNVSFDVQRSATAGRNAGVGFTDNATSNTASFQIGWNILVWLNTGGQDLYIYGPSGELLNQCDNILTTNMNHHLDWTYDGVKEHKINYNDGSAYCYANYTMPDVSYYVGGSVSRYSAGYAMYIDNITVIQDVVRNGLYQDLQDWTAGTGEFTNINITLVSSATGTAQFRYSNDNSTWNAWNLLSNGVNNIALSGTNLFYEFELNDTSAEGTPIITDYTIHESAAGGITQTPTPTADLLNITQNNESVELNSSNICQDKCLLYQDGTNVVNFSSFPYNRTGLSNATSYSFNFTVYNSTYDIPESNFSNTITTTTLQNAVNHAPALSSPKPDNNTAFYGINNITLNVTYTDSDSDAGTVTFQNMTDNSIFCTNSSIATGTTVHCNINVSAGQTEWGMNVTDGHVKLSSGRYNFNVTDYGSLSVSWVNPSANHNQTQYNLTTYIAQVNCTGGYCGAINVTLDPSVLLDDNDTEMTDDITLYDFDTSNFAIELKANLSGLSASLNITKVELCLYWNSVYNIDNDARIWRVDDQTWTEDDQIAVFIGQNLDNETNKTWSSITQNTYGCVDITQQFGTDYNLSNGFSSVRIIDPDKIPGTLDVPSGTDLTIGNYDNPYIVGNDRESGTNTPYINITYDVAPETKTIIPTSYDTPFFTTNSSNPTDLCGVMNDGDICNIEFIVNATGTVGNTFGFNWIVETNETNVANINSSIINITIDNGIYTPPGDSCTCSDGLTWAVDLSGDCILNTACNTLPGTVTFSNTGRLRINATLTTNYTILGNFPYVSSVIAIMTPTGGNLIMLP